MDQEKSLIATTEHAPGFCCGGAIGFQARMHFRRGARSAVTPIHWMSQAFSAIARETTETYVPGELIGLRRLEVLALDDDLHHSGLVRPIRLGQLWQVLGSGMLDRFASNVFGLVDYKGEPITGNAWYREGKGWCIGASPISTTHVWTLGTVLIRGPAPWAASREPTTPRA